MNKKIVKIQISEHEGTEILKSQAEIFDFISKIEGDGLPTLEDGTVFKIHENNYIFKGIKLFHNKGLYAGAADEIEEEIIIDIQAIETK